MGKGRDRRRKTRERGFARIAAFANARKTPALPDEPPGNDNPDAFAYAPLKPKPHLNSGAVALTEPTEVDHLDVRAGYGHS